MRPRLITVSSRNISGQPLLFSNHLICIPETIVNTNVHGLIIWFLVKPSKLLVILKISFRDLPNFSNGKKPDFLTGLFGESDEIIGFSIREVWKIPETNFQNYHWFLIEIDNFQGYSKMGRIFELNAVKFGMLKSRNQNFIGATILLYNSHVKCRSFFGLEKGWDFGKRFDWRQ